MSCNFITRHCHGLRCNTGLFGLGLFWMISHGTSKLNFFGTFFYIYFDGWVRRYCHRKIKAKSRHKLKYIYIYWFGLIQCIPGLFLLITLGSPNASVPWNKSTPNEAYNHIQSVLISILYSGCTSRELQTY